MAEVELDKTIAQQTISHQMISQVKGRSRRGRAHADSGVSTVFGCLSICLLMVVTAVGVHLGGAILAREQAETAADLGALAGAARILQGSAAACQRAGAVVQANRGTLTSCATDGFDLVVQVEIATWGGSASGRARAGPVTTR